MTDIKWEAPPPSAHRPRRRSGGKFADFVDALRARPGETARLVDDVKDLQAARNLAGTIERGKRRGFGPAGAFEAYAAENNKGGKASVWVKFVGDPDGVDPTLAEAAEVGEDDEE